MRSFENFSAGSRRSRRNFLKMSVVAASAIVVKATTAAAGPFEPPPPPGLPSPPGPLPPFGPPARHRGQCFLKGTMIRTVKGDKRIEELAVGDLLPTVFGGTLPIVWIGRYPFRKSDPTKGWPREALPVRIARSALGPDEPRADLCVTRSHALLIDGVLSPACNLINGTTITLYDARDDDEIEFFHIKLERHDAIFAEGVPCETLLNVDENAVNFAEYLRLRGSSLIEDSVPCAPLLACIEGGRAELKSRFRSAISPWIDRRQQADIIRDKLEERGTALMEAGKSLSNRRLSPSRRKRSE